MLFSFVLAILLIQPVDQPVTNDAVGRLLVGVTFDQLDNILGPPTCFVVAGLGSPVLAEYWYQVGDFMIRVHVTFFRDRVTSARCTISHPPMRIR